MNQSQPMLMIRGWGLLILSLHLAARHLPEDQAWSVWPYTFLPAWVGWGLAFLTGLLIIPPLNAGARRMIDRLWPRPGLATVALLSGGLFWLARLRHLRWGDGYMLSVGLSYPDLELRTIYNWQAPLTVFLHQRLWQFGADPLGGWPVERVYAAVSIICGMIFVYLLLRFTAQLGRDPTESTILAGLILTTGSIQLFFGYVENYTIMSLGLLCTLWLAWRSAEGRSAPVWPVLALSITNAFHPSTVFLWPGMGLLVWLSWRRGRVSFNGGLWQLLIPPLVIGGAVLALMESGGHGLEALLGVDRPGGGDGLWFVPLFETTTRWQHYTMFSAAHLFDWLNLHFLISPFGLPLLILLGIFYRPAFDRPAERDYAYFLTLTAAMYLLLTWLWNPDYGARYDWDLFAPSAFVYTLLAGYLLARTLPERSYLADSGLFIIAVCGLHTAAWIFTNTHALPLQ